MADDLIVIAVLLGAHGVRGDCRVKSFTQIASDAFGYGPLLGADGAVLLTPKRRVRRRIISLCRQRRRARKKNGTG